MTSRAPNPMNLWGFPTSMAPRPIDLEGLLTSMAPRNQGPFCPCEGEHIFATCQSFGVLPFLPSGVSGLSSTTCGPICFGLVPEHLELTYVCMYVSIYAYKYICINMYIHIYIYIYIYESRRPTNLGTSPSYFY